MKQLRRTIVPAVLALLWASPAPAQVQPHRSAGMLVSSNGRSVIGYDVAAQRLKSFLEHPYRTRSDGAETRNLAYDFYWGLRFGGAGNPGTWLSDVAPTGLEYVEGTGIIHVTRELNGYAVDEYLFSPIDLPEHAFVSLLKVERKSAAPLAVDAYTLYNFHLGSGAPDPGADGESVEWNPARSAWLEWGPGGATLGYGGVGVATHHSGGSDNPFPVLSAGADLSDNMGGAGINDAAAGLQWSLGSIDGSAGWAGTFVVLDTQSDVLPRIDSVASFIGGKSPEQLLNAEIASWQSWHAPPPAGLSALEQNLYAQSMAVLRMGQVREPGRGDGQILASLPPGMWNISWVRDMSYAAIALSRSGHVAEAKRAIEFQLGADSGKYQDYVGQPYRISITRYFGDGVEESDSNQDGPNIEFDGFGLFLWTLDEYVAESGDTQSLTTWWPDVSSQVADVLLGLQEPNGLIAPDSSIWEVHWNGQQKHFAYTTLTAANGLCRAARLAERVGDTQKAESYRSAGRRAQAALISELSAPDGTIAQSLEELQTGSGYLDAAAIEAVGMGLVDPQGRAAKATLAAMKQRLVPASRRGFFRNDDGGWYDSQEWVFVDLRTVHAMRLMGDVDGAELLSWNTAQGAENFNLISELHAADSADYQGEMPMVGFGAGAYAIALLDRQSPETPLPCGEYAVENGAAGSGGAAGNGAGGAAAGGDGDAEDDAGCGCRTTGGELASSGWLLIAALLGSWIGVSRARRSAVRSDCSSRG